MYSEIVQGGGNFFFLGDLFFFQEKIRILLINVNLRILSYAK